MLGPVVPPPDVELPTPSQELASVAHAHNGVRRARLVWGIQIAAALICGTAGAIKLGGHPAMSAIFERIGAGDWFREITGLAEIAGALMLLRARTAAAGALLLAGVMGGAIAVQLEVMHELPFAAIAVLAMLVAIVAARGEPLERLLSRARTRGRSSRP